MIRPLRPVAREAVADHYDELDTFYREVWGEHVHHGLWDSGTESSEEAVRRLVHHLVARLGVRRGDRVIDVGSGYGATARLLADETGAEVLALTMSPAQHAYAVGSRPDRGNPAYRLGDWLETDLPERSFDRAIAIESTEHMADKAAALDRMRRVLAPGGRAGIYAWIAAEEPSDWMVKYLLEPICREGRLPGMGTETDYRTLLGDAGFEVELVEDLSARVAPTWSRSMRRVASRLVRDPRYRRYLLSSRSRNRDFAASLLRILVAYRTGAMRYLLFVARRPGITQ